MPVETRRAYTRIYARQHSALRRLPQGGRPALIIIFYHNICPAAPACFTLTAGELSAFRLEFKKVARSGTFASARSGATSALGCGYNFIQFFIADMLNW